MKRLFNTVMILLAVFIAAGTANCQENSKPVKADFNTHRWVEQHFAKGKVPPFSFMYGGISSNTFIKSWDHSVEIKKQTDPNIEEFIYTYRDKKSGLTVKCFVSCYKDFPAVEWVLRFTNSSERTSPVIDKAKTIDYSFVSDRKGTFTLYHANGSNAQKQIFNP